MKSERPTSVPHAARWAKRAFSIVFTTLVLSTLVVPTPKRPPGAPVVVVPGGGVPLPPGVGGPKDGVGDSPVMPE